MNEREMKFHLTKSMCKHIYHFEIMVVAPDKTQQWLSHNNDMK